MAETEKTTIWQRLRSKHRISIINESTLAERWYMRLSAWGAIVALGAIFLLALALFSLVILYTPIRHYLPGYSEDIRHQLMEESTRVDSLGTSLELQRQYLKVIQQVVAGEVQSDTVQKLDSMQLIMREQLLEAKSEATAEFLAQYEAKEKDNLLLFENISQPYTQHLSKLVPPVHGVILQGFAPKKQRYHVQIAPLNNKAVSAVQEGTIIYCEYKIARGYTLVMQHEQYVSIYHGLEKALKQVGQEVRSGEVVGMIGADGLGFELWQKGKAVNPEERIVF